MCKYYWEHFYRIKCIRSKNYWFWIFYSLTEQQEKAFFPFLSVFRSNSLLYLLPWTSCSFCISTNRKKLVKTAKKRLADFKSLKSRVNWILNTFIRFSYLFHTSDDSATYWKLSNAPTISTMLALNVSNHCVLIEQ